MLALATNVSQLFKAKPAKAMKTSSEWDKEEQRKKRLLAFVKSIQVSGKGISTGTVNTVNEFDINVDTFESRPPTPVELNHEMFEQDNYVKIAYKVAQPGQYILAIRYLGLPIPCSPFKVQISNAKDVLAFGKGLTNCVTGKINRFHLDMRKSGQGRISVVSSTAEKTDGEDDGPLYIISESKHGYQIQYVTDTTKPFFFHIKCNNKHIPGSPFLVTAGSRKDGIVGKAKMLLQILGKDKKKFS